MAYSFFANLNVTLKVALERSVVEPLTLVPVKPGWNNTSVQA